MQLNGSYSPQMKNQSARGTEAAAAVDDGGAILSRLGGANAVELEDEGPTDVVLRARRHRRRQRPQGKSQCPYERKQVKLGLARGGFLGESV